MDKAKKILILSIIPVFLTLIFILYIVVPVVGKLNVLNKDLKQETSKYNNAKEQLQMLNNDTRLFKSIQGLKDKLGNFDINVPEDDDFSILLIDLGKFAESYNIKVLSLNSKPEAEKEIVDPSKKKKTPVNAVAKKPAPSPLYSISLQISAVGYYQSILDFINTLEKYERTVAINSLKVENYKEDKDTSNPRVQVTIDCDVYKFNPENIEQKVVPSKNPSVQP